LAASPRSYSRSVLTCSPRSRCSRRPDDQFSHHLRPLCSKNRPRPISRPERS
jgi:hypothetical protein